MENLSWKTTVAGALTILAAIVNAVLHALNGQPVDIAALIAAILAGLGLMQAKDHDKTGVS